MSEEAFGVESPGKEPQRLEDVFRQIAAQILDLSALAASAEGEQGIRCTQPEIEGIQAAIDKLRSARDSLQILLRSIAFAGQVRLAIEDARQLLLNRVERALDDEPGLTGSDVLALLRVDP